MSQNLKRSAKIIALTEIGLSNREVARRIGVSEETVRNIKKRHLETGSLQHRPRSGRPRATTSREDRFIERTALQEPQLTSNRIGNSVNLTRDAPISNRTVRRKLVESGLHSRRPATGPVLTPRHRRARLNFARIHEDWSEDDWRSVLFTDESRFTLQGPDGRQRVWRRTGERYSQQMFARRTNFFGGSVMAWCGISLEARTELHIFGNASVNASRYITEVLEDHVVPFAPYIGEEFLLMQDNARPHVAATTRLYLNDVGINCMEWPVCSPDMNPIEHVWDIMGRQVRARPVQPKSLGELRNALLEEWDRFPQESIANLIRSMPRRCQAVIKARGGNTKY